MKKWIALLLLLSCLCPVALAADLPNMSDDELQMLLDGAQAEVKRRASIVTGQTVYEAMYKLLEKPPFDDISLRLRPHLDDPRMYDNDMTGIMYYPLTGCTEYVYGDTWHSLRTRTYKGYPTAENFRSYMGTFFFAVMPDDKEDGIPIDRVSSMLNGLMSGIALTVPGDRITTSDSESGYTFTLMRSVEDDGDPRYEFTITAPSESS